MRTHIPHKKKNKLIEKKLAVATGRAWEYEKWVKGMYIYFKVLKKMYIQL